MKHGIPQLVSQSRTLSSDAQAVDPEMRFSREGLVGPALVAFGVTLFAGFFYAAVASKLLPPYGNRLLAAIQNDW
jgi:hypothetical protein